MAIPVQITFKNMDPSPALEAKIRARAAQLTHFESDILRCHVTVEIPHRHHHQGDLYHVQLVVSTPAGDIVISREGPRNHAHEDAYVAVRDAFDAAVRRLEDHVRTRGGQVKHHEPILREGHVTRFVAGQDYGFIELPDGKEVYFHRHSVADDGFDQLQVGSPVHVAVTEGETGLQAAIVRPGGKRRPAS
ncbi:HPF/RaiA family ribosome-associated protein [Nguyenibacter vanlangensis]|uniref:HPF/RaiA family ribosome-associated protein n=1 Tax=Nguyenibacter vanlangensis TaxID=1216886 RepID=A0A7Y7M5M9_9PROT|nr:HPF/RaiA family ribosome-associated protein [Nguyenibacter vanlangensis]NVN10029.1 HPF/RaiA family ribosome-associated protein [Nguyenibacter vanlangensis]